MHAGKPPDGNLIMLVAERFGQSPQAVEEWDEYWFNRVVAKIQGEALDDKKRAQEDERARKRR